MTESRKIQLISEVDATGAKKGLSEINEAAKRTADEVSKAGKDGAKGLDGINEAGKKLGDGLKRIGREGSDGLRKIPEEANKGAAGIDRATRTIISQIQRTTATLEAGERGTRSYYEAIAKQRGISNEALRPYLEQLEAVRGKQVQATTAAVAGAAGLRTVGVSAAQTAAALRQVPAQLTDIVVGLQAGQAPMTVLLQQGGQLKDMFGGIAPAARALGGAVLGMVNPFTLAAGAAAALAVAYNQGANEAQRYREVLIRSNGAIGVTADQLGAMARRISEVGGTQGQAAAALAEFAGSARVAREDLERFSAAAASLQRVAGVPIAETRKQFEELGKAPAEALLKLNEGTNFLTGALYEQVRALEQQGRTVEAARIAQAAWASETERVASSLEANLGLLERGWRGITSAAKGAWDAMLAVGRESSADDKIRAQVDLVKQLERELASVEARGVPGAQALRGQIAAIKEQIASARQVVQIEAEVAAAKAKTVEQEQAKLRWDAEGLKYMTDRKRLETELANEIKRIRAEGAAVGATQQQIDGRIAVARERFAQATKAAAEATKQLKAEQKGLNDLIADALDRDKQRQKVLDDTAARELDRLRQQEARQAAADQAAKSAADMQRAIEFETQALQMSNVEREIAVAMLKLEEQGIVKGTAAYEHYAEAIRNSIISRDSVRRSVEGIREMEGELRTMGQQAGQSLADALMTGGKSAADYIKGIFRTMVLQPIVRPIGMAFGGFGATGTASAATGGGGSSLGMVGSIAGISGAFGTGLVSSFGSMAAAGVGGWASAAGSLLGSGSLAGFAAGAGMIAAPLIAAGVLASLFKGGETRAGGRYGMVDGQAAFLEGPSGGQVGPMAEAVQSAIDSINATLTAVGSQAVVTGFAAGVETSKNRKGGAFAGGALSTGATFGDTTDAVGWRYTENLDASDAGARFARELQMATIEALQAADLGGVIGRMVEGVDFSSMSDDALAGLSAQIQQTIASVTAFRESIAGLPMANLAGLSFDAAAALVEFSGGLEALQNNLGAYYQQFFSEEERVAALTGQLTAQLAALGFAMPETREGFRALVEAQDLTTDAGQRTYAALLGMANGFASVVPATEILTDVIGDVGGTVTDVAETVEQALARIRAEVRAAEAIARNIIALEQQLYREQNFGDTAALRAQELDGLTAAEQALMRQIWSMQDAREAEARAAEEAARAAREAQTSFVSYVGSARNEWQGLVKSLYDEIRRIRGDLYGGGAMGYAQAQAQFAITSARARAGDQTAAQMLPELSRTLLTLAEANATTLAELQRIRAQTVGSLQGTADLLGRRYGVPAMATGTNVVPRDMLAMLHEGEAVVPKAYNPAAGGGSERELLAEIRSLNARMARIESQATATARHTERAAIVLDDASRGKRPLVTEVSV